jgi:hypothetical protein
MRPLKIVGLVFCLAIFLSLSAQELQHEVRVVNVEVPVRVFKGSSFVDDLKIEDFELYEDGKLQKIESVYLIKRTSVERGEGKKVEGPKVQRTFVFLFQMVDYMPETGKALEYFFENVLSAQDSLIVITPVKTYNLKSETFGVLPKDRIKEQLVGILRKDITLGGGEYRTIMRELEDTPPVNSEQLFIFRDLLEQLERLRVVDQKKMQYFAEFLKKREGQKYVYLFYQKEMIPKLSPSAQLPLTTGASGGSIGFTMELMAILDFYKRDITFDVDLVKKTFSDSSMVVHFLFITKTPPVQIEIARMRPSGMVMAEQSEDIFSAFREVARATGGLTESSSDASVAFKKAVEASENYYLLYYKPTDDRTDGKFREISVKVKRGGVTVSHRAGYFAN